ncbi:hypothetical protein CLU79DRAFT_734629 [Phycomyces nitens]|nr:hypothetical protein CLU79DRAFT_734629 [Phycomyces nitens]
MTASELPLEILGWIAGRLSITDIKTCSCVCHGWQPAFQKELWRRAKFRSHKQLVSFVETITNPDSNTYDFGQYTREITFHKQAKLKVDILEILQTECKGVYKLEFEKGSAERGCFASALHWEEWKDLQDLTMCLDGITRTDFLRSLGYLSNLKSLALPSDLWDSHGPFTFDYVNAIHQHIPHLESFSVVGHFDALTKADMIALPKVSQTQVVSLITKFYTTQLMWIVYWAYKHPQIQTLRFHMDVYNNADSEPDSEMVHALENIPVAFKCLENLHITGVTSRTWPFLPFFDLLARSKTALRTLFYTLYIHPSNPSSVMNLLQAAARSTAESLTGLQLGIWGILDDPLIIPMSLHGFHKLTRVEILGEHTSLAINVLLDNCANLDDLSVTASSVVLNTIETPGSKHVLRKLWIEKAVMEAKILNYISYRCLNLKRMYLGEVNIFGGCPDDEPAKHLFDMHYTNFDKLSMVKTAFFNQSSSSCSPDKRINLLCVRRGGREDDSDWHHIFSLSSIIYSRTSCQQLSEEATSQIKAFYESPESIEIPESTRFDNGCVKKQCWPSDLVRGYVLMECGSVQQLAIDNYA